MQHPSIINAIETVPVELRDSVARWFERLVSAHGNVELPGDTMQRIAKLVACSEFASSVLLKEWHWFVAGHETLEMVVEEVELTVVEVVEVELELVDSV